MNTQTKDALVKARAVLRGLTYKDSETTAALESIARALEFEGSPPQQPAPAAVAGPEHELKDVRCECCGYMTYHREHMGCIRAAYAATTRSQAKEGE